MDGILMLIVAVLALALIDGAALRWGVDSRFGSKDPRRQDEPIGLR